MTLPSEENVLEAGGGLGTARFLAALTLGAIGGAIACGIYYFAGRATGLDVRCTVGLAGLLVGVGVRWGAGGRRGLGCQVLAMVLTYGAAVGTHGRDIRDALAQASLAEEAPAKRPAAGVQQAASPKEPSWETLTTGQRVLVVAVTLGVVLGLTVLAPLLGPGNMVELLCLAFALLCAGWLNRTSRERSAPGPLEMSIHGRR